MTRFSVEQKKIIKEMLEAGKRSAYWHALGYLCKEEASELELGTDKHIDANKTRRDSLGKKLLRLHDGFGQAYNIAEAKFQDLWDKAKGLGVPEKTLFRIFFSTHDLQPRDLGMSRDTLLLYLHKDLPLREAKARLLAAIRESGRMESGKEATILWKYLKKFKKKNEPAYEPPRYVKDWAKLGKGKHFGRKMRY